MTKSNNGTDSYATATVTPITTKPAGDEKTTEPTKTATQTAVQTVAPSTGQLYSHGQLTLPQFGRSADLIKRRAAAGAGCIPKPPRVVDSTITRILQWRRAHNSPGEKAFCEWLVAELTSRLASSKGPKIEVLLAHDKDTNMTGGYVVRIPLADGGKSTTLFSCHIDTVDSSSAAASEEKQAICYDPTMGHIFLDRSQPKHIGTCLGADDGVGIWMMLNMISARKPGTYVFHRGEEKGGIGAHLILRKFKAFLEEHEVAIAFDRPDDNEIITRQGGDICASDKCAEALRVALEKQGLIYKASANGLFTDTKIYRGVISECFNLGVGYYNQHTINEHLDYGHATRLLAAVKEIDFDALPVDRDHTKPDPRPSWQGNNSYRGYGGWAGHGYDREELDAELGAEFNPKANAKPILTPQQQAAAKAASNKAAKDKQAAQATSAAGKRAAVDDPTVGLVGMTVEDVAVFVEDNPDASVTLIIELYAELAAAKTRIETYRDLLGLNDA